MYKNGSNKNELLGLLESMSELTGLDRVVRSNQKFHIDAEIRGRDLYWAMDVDDYADYNSTNIQTTKGKGYPTLCEALKQLNEEGKADEQITVLALADVDPARNYDNTINTVWYVIDPCSVGMDDADHELDLETGYARIELPILQLKLTEAEYKCCGSRLAFYDEFSDILYPIQECAYSSIGALLDCACVFKYHSNTPITAATFLAERLAGTNNIRFLYRERTERVRPLISIVGRNYILYSQYEFVKEACEIVQQHCISHVESWSVTDELTKATIVIDGMNALWHPEIELQVSDTVGSSMAISAFIKMGKGRILLKRNTAYKWPSFKKNGGVSALFEGVFESISNFENSFESVSHDTVLFDASALAPYLKILGKKRFYNLNLPETGRYNFADLLYRVVDATHFDLNPRWSLELVRENAKFFEMLSGKETEEEQEAKIVAV